MHQLPRPSLSSQQQNPLLDSASPLTVMAAASGAGNPSTPAQFSDSLQQQQQQQQQLTQQPQQPVSPNTEEKQQQQGPLAPAAPTPTPAPPAGQLEPAVALLLYSTCSVSMILLNKLVMDTYHMNFPLGLLFLQNAAAFLLVVVAKALKFIDYPPFDPVLAKKWLPLTVFFCLMLYSSMRSLAEMSVATQTILKNLAIILTALGDAKWFGKKLTPMMFAAFGLMAFGSWLGTSQDHSGHSTTAGIIWTLANVLITVAYTLYMRVITGQLSSSGTNSSRWTPVYLNNLLSLPFLFVPAVPSLPSLFAAIQKAPPPALLCLAAMVGVSAAMTFSVFFAMRVTSPTTFSITGALCKVPVSIFGIILWAHYPTTLGYVGICCALGAGVLYAWVSRPAAVQQAKERERSV